MYVYIYIHNWELGMSEGQHKEFTKYVSSVKHVLGRDVIYTCMNSSVIQRFYHFAKTGSHTKSRND